MQMCNKESVSVHGLKDFIVIFRIFDINRTITDLIFAKIEKSYPEDEKEVEWLIPSSPNLES